MKAPIRSVSDWTPIITRVFAQCRRANRILRPQLLIRTRLPGPGLNFTRVRISAAPLYIDFLRIRMCTYTHTASERASERERSLHLRESFPMRERIPRRVSMEKRSRDYAITSPERYNRNYPACVVNGRRRLVAVRCANPVFIEHTCSISLCLVCIWVRPGTAMMIVIHCRLTAGSGLTERLSLTRKLKPIRRECTFVMLMTVGWLIIILSLTWRLGASWAREPGVRETKGQRNFTHLLIIWFIL